MSRLAVDQRCGCVFFLKHKKYYLGNVNMFPKQITIRVINFIELNKFILF
jgi:hypothetical protein